MTEQEKNIIKNEILDQLLSSSKSIDQLSKESRLKDDDLFEINGGRYITGKTIIEACSAGSSLKEYLKRSEADGLYQPIGNYLTQQSLADYYTKTEADARYLSRDLFDSLFELVNRGSEDNPEWVIRAKHSLYTDGWLSGKGPYNGSGADAPPGGGATELRMLDDVLLSDPLSKGDVLSFDGQKWTNAPVQLPSLAGYATEAWVESKGYLTAHQSLADYARKSEVKAVSDRLDDFLTGSDTDTVINKWKELETFLSGMKESDNLATLLSGKVDKRDGYGLSKNDFTDSLLQKLNGIEAGANKYVLPIAKAAVLGGVMIGSSLTASATGVLDLPVLHTAPATHCKVTFDKYGRITSGTSLAESDIPALSISKITGLQTALDKKLDKSVFDELFEKVKLADGTTAIHAKYGFYSDSFVTAKGPYGGGDGSSGGTGGGASYDRYDGTWGDYTTAFDAYVVSGKSGKALYDRTVTNYNSISALSGRMSAVESNRIKVDGTNGTHAGVSELVQTLLSATGAVTDSMEFVTSNVDPTATRLFYRRPASSIWAYVKAKADSVYQAKGNFVTIDTAQTITGQKSFTKNVQHENESKSIYKTHRKKADGGGWAFDLLSCVGNDNVRYFGIGADGVHDEFAYVFLGAGAYNSEVNLRITAGGTALAKKFAVYGGTSAQFLKADGSVDSNTYALSSALAGYLPLTGGTLTGALTVPTLYVGGSDAYMTVNGAGGLYVSVGGKSLMVWDGAGKLVRPSTDLGGAVDLGTSSYRWKTLYANAINVASTSLVSNLNADLLDGHHKESFESRYHTGIDARHLDANTWYPVVMQLGNSERTRIRIEGHSSAPASWNAREDKCMAVVIDYTVNGSSWGWSPLHRVFHEVLFGAGAPPSVVCGAGQLTNHSDEYIFVRGGAYYNFYTSRWVKPTLYTSTYTGSGGQSIAPTTTQPAPIARTNAWLTDNVASATKLQTARNFSITNYNGSNPGTATAFDGTADAVLKLPSRIYASDWFYSVGNTGWYSETHGGGWYMSDSTWVRTYNQKSVYTGAGQIRSDYFFTREGYAGDSWHNGYGAYNVAIYNNDRQTPLMVAYRQGSSQASTGADRLLAMELLNNGTVLNFGFCGLTAFSFFNSGKLRAAGEITSTSTNAFRAVYGNYGFFLRNDGRYTYFMLTASGDQYGSYNALRPLYVSNTTGKVYMGNGLSVSNGISTDSLRIGDAVLTWDSSAKMLKVSTGLYSEGQVSGKGPGNSAAGSGSGSGSLFGLMKSWPSSDPGTGTTDALGANLGWELYQTKLSKTEAQTLYQPAGNYVRVGGDGVSEIGRYIDFHSGHFGTNTKEDYTARIDAGASTTARVLTLPTSSGTLALTSQIPTSMAWSAITGKPAFAHTASECTTYTSDDSSKGVTAAAVKKAFTMFKAVPPTFAEVTSKPTTLGGYGITDAVTIDTDQFVKGRKMFLGAVDFRMKADTSNAVALRWIKTDGTTAIANICYHNTVQRLIFNPVGSAEVWNDKAGNYSLIVGNNELTYNTKAILREDNYTSYVSTLRDRTNGTATYLNYGASGLTTASWLAAWNGYELRAISPSNVRSVIGAVAKAGDTMTGPLALQMGVDTKLIFNNTDGEKYTVLSFREANAEYSKITAVENKFIFSKLVHAPYYVADTTTLCTNLNADLLDGIHAGHQRGQIPVWRDFGSFSGVNNGDTGDESNYRNFLKRITGSSQYGSKIDGPNFMGTLTPNSQRFVIGSVYAADAYKDGYPQYAYFLSIPLLNNPKVFGTNGGVYYEKTLAFTTDNVASATRLQGTYKLWGQNFYGNNVDGAMTINYTGETGIALYRNETGGGAFIRFYNTNQTANYFRMGMFADSRFGIGYNSGTDAINILTNGNVGIGTSAPAYTFDVDGSFRATGDIWFNQWGRITYSSGGWLQLTNGTNHISALNGAQMTQLTVHANTVQTLNGNLQAYNSSTKNSSVVMPGGIELIHGTPYIDFHFGQSTADFTARIIADEDNALRILGGSNFKLKIGNGYIQWDSTLAMFHFSHGIYSDGQVTAKGPASASKSATGLEDSGIALMSDSVPDSEIDALWTEIASLKARVYQLESRMN